MSLCVWRGKRRRDTKIPQNLSGSIDRQTDKHLTGNLSRRGKKSKYEKQMKEEDKSG